jgi:hypothetical protein
MNCSQKKIVRSSNKEITMPNGMDPKAYAARVTKAKKTVAKMDPATKAKLSEYYPEITTKDIAKQMTNPKTTLSDMAKRIKAKPTATPKATVTKKAAAKPMAKPAAKVTPKTTTKAPTKKLVGPAAVEALKKRVSPAGVKKAEMDAKKAIDKKYPGLYKKSK